VSSVEDTLQTRNRAARITGASRVNELVASLAKPDHVKGLVIVLMVSMDSLPRHVGSPYGLALSTASLTGIRAH
jgi:hypothetical protein